MQLFCDYGKFYYENVLISTNILGDLFCPIEKFVGNFEHFCTFGNSNIQIILASTNIVGDLLCPAEK